jgi:type VI protein secretion system component VasA
MYEQYQSFSRDLKREQPEATQLLAYHPYWQRLLEANTLLAAKCQTKLSANHASLSQRFFQACFPHLLTATPVGMVVQVHPQQQITLDAHTPVQIQTDCETHTFYTCQTHQLTPMHCSSKKLLPQTQGTDILFTFDPETALIDEVIFYIDDKTCAQHVYSAILNQSVQVCVNQHNTILSLAQLTWLPQQTQGLSASLLTLKEYSSFHEKFQFFKCNFPLSAVTSMRLHFKELHPLALHPDHFYFNCLPVINLLSTQTTPMPSQAEIACHLELANSHIVDLESVHAVSTTSYQRRKLTSADYWLSLRNTQHFLHLVAPCKDEVISCQVRYCQDLQQNLDPHSLCFTDSLLPPLTLRSPPSRCQHPVADAQRYFHAYLQILNRQVEVPQLRQLLNSFQLYQLDTVLAECRISYRQRFSQGMLQHNCNYDITLANTAPAYRYAILCHAVAQLLDALWHKTTIRYTFQTGEQVICSP